MAQSPPPKVRIAKPAGRPFQLRYTCHREGREIRISTGTHDEREAAKKKKELEAKLLLGMDTKPHKRPQGGERMPWEEFREEYTRLKVATFRSEQAMDAAEIMLDVCESILKPRTLADMAGQQNLTRLQSELLAGTNSSRGKRSPNTVRSYIATLKAALNWAHQMGWLPAPCTFRPMEADHDNTLKGRPLTDPEFFRMLEATEAVCGSEAAGSWRFLLRGLLESGLRLAEAMHLHWQSESAIRPLKTRSGGYLLRIPAGRQKNRRTEEIPTTPQFGMLLDEVPAEDRSGWVFNPQPLRDWNRRLSVQQAGRIITRIGKAAEVFVSEEGKPASAHDLRRTFGQRMADAGLPPRDLQAIMRHANLSTTEKYYLRHRAADQADRIAMYLSRRESSPTPQRASDSEQSQAEAAPDGK